MTVAETQLGSDQVGARKEMVMFCKQCANGMITTMSTFYIAHTAKNINVRRVPSCTKSTQLVQDTKW